MSSVDGDQLELRLGILHQMLHGQSMGVVERLCQEIAEGSQGHIQLRLQRYQPGQTPSVPGTVLLTLPVHLNDRFYGRLLIGSDPARPTQPILPMARMQRIALNCASILYSLETAAYFQIEYPALPVDQSRPLTRRQREVLDLLCRHIDRKTIAEMLHISPGTVEKAIEFIYKKFGVHSEREAVAAAFALGLFFPVEHLSATIAPSTGLRETPAIE